MLQGEIRRAYLKAQLAIREITALSWRTMRAITVNSVRMSVHDLRARRALGEPGVVTDCGAFTGASATSDGGSLAVTFERATLQVHALSDDLVRLAWGPGRAPIDVVTRDASPVPPTTVRVETGGRAASLTTGALRVEVDVDGVRVLDASGHARYVERTPLARGPRRTLRRVLRDGERLCGLGEQARGFDLTGGSYRLWNRDPGGSWGTGQNPLYASIPVTVGLHPTGPVWAFHENTHEAEVVVGRVAHAAHGCSAEFHDGALVTYVAVGELDALLTTAATLTGRPAMPPRWALGYHHCRWGWRTDGAVRDVLNGFARRELPISAVHLDIDHMDAFRVFTFDATRFGHVAELAATAATSGTRLVAIVDPAVRRDEGYPLYLDGIRDGHFVRTADGRVELGTVWPGWAAFPDFARSSTRTWWSHQYSVLTSNGIAGAWHDMNEPTSITLWGDRTLPRDAMHDVDGVPTTHAEVHNLYGLLMDAAGHEALSGGEARPFLLSRSGWAGLARYAWHWTADVESSKAGLAQQVPTFLGLGLSSVPFTGSDIGGFSGIPTPGLYVRWLELGVVSPFCRTHCVLGAPDREPWTFEPPFDAAVERLVRLRYRLLPHLYRLAEEAHRLGHPMLRPVDWPVDGITGSTGSASAVLLGNELLVVPVADPEASTVAVDLPAGTWRRLRLCEPIGGSRLGEADLPGGTQVALDAPLGQPVVLQREGTIVVLDDAWVDPATTLDLAHSTSRWTLHVHLDADGAARGQGYEDAGDGGGPSRRDAYEARADGSALVLSWSSDGMFEHVGSVSVVLHGRAYREAAADGHALAGVHVDADATTVVLEGPFSRLTLR